MGAESGSGAPPDHLEIVIHRLRRLARGMLNGIERLLHPWHRRRALRRFAQNGPPDALLILCHGNICRSPYAAERLRQLLDGAALMAPRIESAGFILPGRQSPEIARRVAHRRDVDLDDHRSRVVNAALVGRAGAILVMTPGQRRDVLRDVAATAPPPVLLLGDFDDRRPDRRTILDPYGQSEDVFDHVFERIDRCCRELSRVFGGTGLDSAPGSP